MPCTGRRSTSKPSSLKKPLSWATHMGAKFIGSAGPKTTIFSLELMLNLLHATDTASAKTSVSFTVGERQRQAPGVDWLWPQCYELAVCDLMTLGKNR